MSTLTSAAVSFQWTGGTGVSRYWLYVGTTPGAFDFYNQDSGTQLTATVSGLPTNGSTVYVRLWSLIAGTWEYNDYTLTATTSMALRARLTIPTTFASAGSPWLFVQLSHPQPTRVN
jgi:hypothetical protein